MASTINTEFPPAGLIRRLMAILYDGLLLLALLFAVTLFANLLNSGEAITPEHPFYLIYVSILILISFYYFIWFWTHGGQTLGMKTWKLKMVDGQMNVVNIQQAITRAFSALLSWLLFGVGFLISLFHPNKKTLHDIISGTILIDLR